MTPNHHRAASIYHNIGIEAHAAKQDQHQLVALLYESLLESLHAWLGVMVRRDAASKVSQIDKVLPEGLFAHLDLDRGRDLDANLTAVYDHAGMTLTQANLRNDPAKVQKVITILKPIAHAWTQIDPGPAAASAP